MAGPWEQYQQPAAAPSGPWMQYQGEGVPGARASLVDQIPGYGGAVPAATTPAAPTRTSMLDKLRGGVETGAALVSGAATAPIVEASKIYGALTSGQFGTPEGLRAGEQLGQRVAGQIQYQPRTAAGQQYTADVANAMARTGLQGVPMNVLADFQRGAVPAVKAGVQYGRDAQAARAASTAEAQSAADWARAPQIEAAQAAQRLGVAINPAEANPNVKTKMLVGATGEAVVNAKAVKTNLPKWNEVARKDLGLPENTPLTAESFEKARAPHYQPYEDVRKMGVLQASDDVLNDLGSLKLDPLSTSNPEKAMKVNGVVDRTIGQVAEGLSGENVVGQIRGFRKDATRVLKNPNSTPIDIDVAEAQIGIANSLENLIEANVKDPKTLDRLRAARTAIAKSYDWERATGVTTQQVDPLQIAKMAEKGAPLTGALADVAKVAGNFPEIASTTVAKEPLLYQRLRRGGAGGTLGFALGGGPVGAAIGAGMTSLGSEGVANMLARPGVQNRLAIPADRRIPFPTEPAAPVQPIPQSRAVVPFDYSQQAFTPPNFTMVNEQYGPQVTPVTPNMMNALPAPSAQGTMGALAAEQQRAAGMSRTLGQQAEQQAAAAEAAARRPASRGAILEVDPVTGKITVGAEGGKGVTPATQVIESTGKSLQGAADLLAAGKSPALMTAEQKIAWDKTKVDLAEVVPGMKTLNDKAIAAKMQDRAWVQDSLDKARQKAQAFQDIAARAENERLRQDALIKREQMMDLAEQLQDALGSRPVKRGGQGPKTRAFQRNMLTPEQEIQNALAK